MKSLSKKRIVVVMLIAIMMFSQQAVVSFATGSEPVNSDYRTEEQWQEGYEKNPVHIFPSFQRIDSNGYFDYYFGYSLTSDKFKLKSGSTSTTISTNSSADSGSPTTTFNIILFEKSGLFYSNKGAKSFPTNGYGSQKWSSLTAGSTYYFEMTVNSVNVGGSGSISNFGNVL